MNKSWERFVLWLDKTRPGFLLYYGEGSEETLKEFNLFLRKHVETSVEVTRKFTDDRREFDPWECECGSLVVNEVFSNGDRIIAATYDTNRPYHNVHFSNLENGWESISFNCAKCLKNLDTFEEMRVLTNMGEIV